VVEKARVEERERNFDEEEQEERKRGREEEREKGTKENKKTKKYSFLFVYQKLNNPTGVIPTSLLTNTNIAYSRNSCQPFNTATSSEAQN